MLDLLQGIEVIIFDFGNVLIDLDYQRVIRQFSDLARKNVGAIEEMVVTAPVLQRFETGVVSPEVFRSEINTLLGIQLFEKEFDDIWNSMLKGVSKKRLDKILQIGKNYDTYILSNSNIIHEQAFETMVAKATGMSGIRDFVKEAYFSHEIGLRKPNINCYQHVVKAIDNDPSRMLFLDDRLDNVMSAQIVGMKALQVKAPDQQLNEIFGFE